MISRNEVTHQRAVDSLYSTTCPACGDRKGEQKSLCFSCFTSLDRTGRDNLYKRVGQGYEEALSYALRFLDAEKFHDPRPEIPE